MVGLVGDIYVLDFGGSPGRQLKAAGDLLL